MGQQISVQLEAGEHGAKERLSLTPTPRKQSPPLPLAGSTNTATEAAGPATPPMASGVLLAPVPPLGQPSPDDGGDSVINLCDSPTAAALTPTAGGGACSSSSPPSNRFVLIEIPEDATRCLLACMGISSLVKLSVCSKTLAESVYSRSRSYLWETIDLSTLSYKQRPALTDRSLHRQLEAVNAKEVTKTLSLRHCHKVQGFGLEPLRGSVVLEELDLRVKQVGM